MTDLFLSIVDGRSGIRYGQRDVSTLSLEEINFVANEMNNGKSHG